MQAITATEVNTLRKQTGAGMMDCKKALVESSGDFERAIDILRRNGQKVAAQRADRKATEGVVLATTNDDNTRATIVSLNCETDFVAKNTDFIALVQNILKVAAENFVSNKEELNALRVDSMSVGDKIVEQIGVIGEKLEVSIESVEGVQVTSYMHPGNRLATIVGLSEKVDDQIAKNMAMQVAAMNPIAIDKDSIPKKIIDREIEVGKEKAKEEGKPEEMLEKIAMGRLNKFFKENTLINQEFIKDRKKSVQQYLNEHKEGLTVTSFKRVGLGV